MLRRAREAKNSTGRSRKKRFQLNPEPSREPGQVWAGGAGCLIVKSQHPQSRARFWPSERVPLVLLEMETVKLSQIINLYCWEAKSTKETGSQRKLGHCLKCKASPIPGICHVFSPSACVFLVCIPDKLIYFSSKIKGRKSSWSH